MPKPLRTCLTFLLLATLASAVCLGVWLAGSLLFGLPNLSDRIGPAGSDLPAAQETLLGAYLAIRSRDLERPAGLPAATLALDIAEGESADMVIGRMSEAGIVRDPALFLAYLRYRGLDRGIQAGTYSLTGQMSIREIAEALQSAQADLLAITFPEGWRREQMAEALAALGASITPEAFLEATQFSLPGYSFSAQVPPGYSLEGFLFPDTYLLAQHEDAPGLVRRMLENFERKVSPELREGFARQGLRLYQAVTLASIIEREAVVTEERPRIAAVFLNRLRQGMTLDADPTVQYALGRQADGSWWKAPLTAADLQIESPFNTYRITGLPPGPIANPGLASLQAVAFPATTSELYFRAACDGSGRHLFAETYEQHLQNACP